MFGPTVGWTELSVPQARAVARLVADGDTQGYRFVEARRHFARGETIVVDVHVDRPQKFVHPLKAVERLALYFPPDGQPGVLSLRVGFPDAPHTNPGHASEPVSICIDDRPWSEARLSWTPTDFLVRIQIWLAKTARGELHGDARAPEPIFVAPGPVLIVARSDLLAASEGPIELNVYRPDPLLPREVLIATSAQIPPDRARLNMAVIAFAARSQPMGRLRYPPENFGELSDEVGHLGLDFRTEIKKRIREWVSNAWSNNPQGKTDPIQLGSRLGIIIGFPVANEADGDVGLIDLKGFFTTVTIGTLGVALGCLAQSPDGVHASLLSDEDGAAANDIKLACGEVHLALDRTLAATVSGRDAHDSRRVTLVGAGTVGSHVASFLAQEGLFEWNVIDSDYLLPHNIPRHVLAPTFVGWSKARTFADHVDKALGDPRSTGHLVADVMSTDDAVAAEVEGLFAASGIVMDASASVAVSRFVSGRDGGARCVSFFFNSAGTDAVLQIEPANRSATLRDLEAQHYAMTVALPGLAGHLQAAEDKIAYSGACRQATNRMPESRAALLSSLIATELKDGLRDDVGRVVVWRTADASVTRVSSEPLPWERLFIGDWKVALSSEVTGMLAGKRHAALPAETGGVLLGVLDMVARSIHVAVAFGAPTDSHGDQTEFVRGVVGLRQRIVDATDASGGQLVYVGEWHSHPESHAAKPSRKDALQLAELACMLDANGVPALMAIVGHAGTRVHSASVLANASVTVVEINEALR
jgi:Prokaryotic E2 family A/Prokaryotic homologs of the JAB domain/ThiF family